MFVIENFHRRSLKTGKILVAGARSVPFWDSWLGSCETIFLNQNGHFFFLFFLTVMIPTKISLHVWSSLTAIYQCHHPSPSLLCLPVLSHISTCRRRRRGPEDGDISVTHGALEAGLLFLTMTGLYRERHSCCEGCPFVFIFQSTVQNLSSWGSGQYSGYFWLSEHFSVESARLLLLISDEHFGAQFPKSS